jgi:hypothetical protein
MPRSGVQLRTPVDKAVGTVENATKGGWPDAGDGVGALWRLRTLPVGCGGERCDGAVALEHACGRGRHDNVVALEHVHGGESLVQ